MTQEYFLPALRGYMGDWDYYVCLMPLRELAERVGFASEVHEAKRLSEWIQRVLDTNTRVREIAAYLKREPQHFFNSLVVAVYGGRPSWYSFAEYRATMSGGVKESDISEFARDSVGFLSFAGPERLFALDGQHRLAGIKEAIKQGTDFDEESVSVIFVGHSESSRKGRERTRRLFTVLNKTAVKVSKKDIIALDEDDVMAICTRRFVEKGPLLDSDRVCLVESSNLPPGDERSLTTIGNLYDILKILFRDAHGGDEDELRFHRPPDPELESYFKKAKSYFRSLAKAFPPLGEFFAEKGDRAKLVRKYRNSSGGHLLFRPVGLRIITKVIATLTDTYSLDEAVELAGKLPTDLKQAPMKNVLWRQKIQNGGAAVVRDTFLYMLDSYPQAKEADLLKRYRSRVEDDGVHLPKKIV